jgi:hypothetical protein
VLMVSTGMRRGEVLGLRWQDVDLDAAQLSVRQTLINIDYEMSCECDWIAHPRAGHLAPGPFSSNPPAPDWDRSWNLRQH